MQSLRKSLLTLLALGFLFEAWLWNRLEPIVAALVGLIPWPNLKQKIAAQIEKLPPLLTLVVFIIPATMLFPLKLVGLWLLAHKHWALALLMLAFAKLVGLGVTAFLFDVTRPKLLQLAWFRRIYDRVLIWLAWAHRIADPVKERLRRMLRMFTPQKAGRTFKLLWRIRRRRMQTA